MKNLCYLTCLLICLQAGAVEPGQPAYHDSVAYPNGLPERVSWRPNQPHYDRCTWLHDADGVIALVPWTNAPDGMVVIPGTHTNTIFDGVATESWQVETEAEAAARAQAAQYAQLQAVVDSEAGPQIRMLEALITKYAIPRPATPSECLAVIGAAKDAAVASGDTMSVAEAGADGVILLTLYSGLTDAGLDATTINSAWLYMVATGQEEAE